MTPRWKGRIIQHLRKLSLSYDERYRAKLRTKVAPSTYKCQHCGILIYDGKSDLDKVCEKNKLPKAKVIAGKMHMDHIEPMIDPSVGFQSWDELIDRLFCSSEGYQGLCADCHRIKTDKENGVRTKAKKQIKKKRKK
jgi:5-methylcytosine-specific restriction endonuclease McrA